MGGRIGGCPIMFQTILIAGELWDATWEGCCVLDAIWHAAYGAEYNTRRQCIDMREYRRIADRWAYDTRSPFEQWSDEYPPQPCMS